MTVESLRKLSRVQLLELMLQQQETIEVQEEKIKELEDALSEKRIILETSGSIADAALRLHDIFSVAQEAADQYLYSIKEMAEKKEQEDEKTL